jgi:hypothetical protein
MVTIVKPGPDDPDQEIFVIWPADGKWPRMLEEEEESKEESDGGTPSPT